MQLSHADEFTSKNLRFKDGPRKAGLSLLLMGYPSVIVCCDSHTSTVSLFLFSLATSCDNSHSCESSPTRVGSFAFLQLSPRREICFLVFSFVQVRLRLWALPLCRAHLCQYRCLVTFRKPSGRVFVSKPKCFVYSHRESLMMINKR